MPYGFSYCGETVVRSVTLHCDQAAANVALVFEPYQSLVFRMDTKGDVEFIDVAYRPRVPLGA